MGVQMSTGVGLSGMSGHSAASHVEQAATVYVNEPVSTQRPFMVENSATVIKKNRVNVILLRVVNLFSFFLHFLFLHCLVNFCIFWEALYIYFKQLVCNCYPTHVL